MKGFSSGGEFELCPSLHRIPDPAVIFNKVILTKIKTPIYDG